MAYVGVSFGPRENFKNMECRAIFQQQSSNTASRIQTYSRRRGRLTRKDLSARKRPGKRILDKENVSKSRV